MGCELALLSIHTATGSSYDTARYFLLSLNGLTIKHECTEAHDYEGVPTVPQGGWVSAGLSSHFWCASELLSDPIIGDNKALYLALYQSGSPFDLDIRSAIEAGQPVVAGLPGIGGQSLQKFDARNVSNV